MDIGMLWYSADRKLSLLDKVSEAAAYYAEKYGQRPNVCYVHPSALTGELQLLNAGGVLVKPYREVIKDHHWIGVEDRLLVKMAPTGKVQA